MRPHTIQDPQKTTPSVKTVVQAARKLTCLHVDSRWEDFWTLGLPWDRGSNLQYIHHLGISERGIDVKMVLVSRQPGVARISISKPLF